MEMLPFEKKVYEIFRIFVNSEQCLFGKRRDFGFCIVYEGDCWCLYLNNDELIMESGSLFLICEEALFQLGGKNKDNELLIEFKKAVDKVIDCSDKKMITDSCLATGCDDREILLFNIYSNFVSLGSFGIGESDAFIVFIKNEALEWEVFDNFNNEKRLINKFSDLYDALMLSMDYFKKDEKDIEKFAVLVKNTVKNGLMK